MPSHITIYVNPVVMMVECPSCAGAPGSSLEKIGFSSACIHSWLARQAYYPSSGILNGRE